MLIVTAGEPESLPAMCRHRQSATLLPSQANHILPQQIERNGEENDVLHQEEDVACHGKKAVRS